MKSYTKQITMNVPARMDFVNITPVVEEAVRESQHPGRIVPVQCDAHYGQRVHQR